jgi:hypothetical protein
MAQELQLLNMLMISQFVKQRDLTCFCKDVFITGNPLIPERTELYVNKDFTG